MKKSKLIKIFIILIICISIIGCENKNKDDISTGKIDSSKYETKGLKELKCERDTETSDGIDVDIKINAYYDNDRYLKVLKTKEVVKSKDKSVLTEYKNAYEKVYSAYKNIKYYENIVEEANNKVTSTTYINYGKVDMNKLLEIEGTDNNVKITDGKIKIDDWKSFAKKYGTVCSE